MPGHTCWARNTPSLAVYDEEGQDVQDVGYARCDSDGFT